MEQPVPCQLTLLVSDPSGYPLEARVRIRGSDGLAYPSWPDPERLSYGGAGGYFYTQDGNAQVTIPTGMTRITVGKGFEWKSVDLSVEVQGDTSLAVVLDRFVDLRVEGWYGGELHSHTRHPPIEYEIDPLQAKRVARAEDLSVVHFLDQNYEFTGGPHALSDDETILYFTFEVRNQAYGHAPMPGLRAPVIDWCCHDPLPAYPMLLDLRNQVVPAVGPMIVLAHPHTTDDYFYDDAWPGAGLGRELPVLAALGALDVLEVVSYGNDPWEDWTDWYDVLSAGIPCSPGTGTDVRLCSLASLPVGSWRVYANLGPGAPLDYDGWVSALQAGRSFITNYPLIPAFSVDGVEHGGTLEVEGEDLDAEIHLRALCKQGLRKLSLVAEGDEVWSADLSTLRPRTQVDTVFAIQIPTPGWIGARVEGLPGNPHVVGGQPLAHTNVVRITQQGNPIRRTVPSGRWLDDLEKLTTFVELRGNWGAAWQRDTVLARIDRAAEFYGAAFVVPPDPFALLYPGDGDSVVLGGFSLLWQPADDPEEGDRIEYGVLISPDSTFSHPLIYKTEGTEYQLGGLLPVERYYWWAVDATDRGGNVTRSTPPISCFYLRGPTASAQNPAFSMPLRPRALPNPSNGVVRLEGLTDPVEIIDPSGRRVAGSGDGVAVVEGVLVWDGRIRGRPAPPGCYWVRNSDRRSVLRLIRVR